MEDTDTHCCIKLAGFQEIAAGRFSSSFRVRRMGLKNECFEKHMARLEKLPLLFLSGSPAGLCIFKVSHKSQMHIAVCSDLTVKK